MCLGTLLCLGAEGDVTQDHTAAHRLYIPSLVKVKYLENQEEKIIYIDNNPERKCILITYIIV